MSEKAQQNAPERCSCCTCGYTWVKGQHGGHSCAQVMKVTVADLRARLAKYEDAEGNPISTIAEQAREVERLRLNIAEYNEHERCYQSEIERLKEGQSILILARDEQNRLANEYRDLWSRAALKAKPSGVVLADDIRAAYQNAVEVFAEETNAAQCREVAEYMREVLLVRLNSFPVSADLTASECACGDQYPANSYGAGFMAANNGVCENCDAANSVSAGDDRKLSDIGNELHNLSCHVVHHNEGWANQLGTLASELWNWQARAALTASAPNHSEQVREVGPDQALLSDVVMHLTNWLDMHECECENGHVCGRGHVRATRDKVQKLLAAAPSACSCGEPDTAGTHRKDGPCQTVRPSAGSHKGEV